MEHEKNELLSDNDVKRDTFVKQTNLYASLEA